MFSDADPAVAQDPKQQHRELTKLGIYAGIPVAVHCLPKPNNNLCVGPDLPGKHFLTSVFSFSKKNPSNVIFLSSKLQQSVLLFIVWLKPEI